VTKSNLHLSLQLHAEQTLVNAERFITPELKEFETKAPGAQEAICQLEYRLFEERSGIGFLRHFETAEGGSGIAWSTCSGFGRGG